MHAVLLNFSTELRQWLILNALTPIGFLSVNYSSNEKREEHGDDDTDILSVYWFLSHALMLFSHSLSLTSTCTARKGKNEYVAGKYASIAANYTRI